MIESYHHSSTISRGIKHHTAIIDRAEEVSRLGEHFAALLHGTTWAHHNANRCVLSAVGRRRMENNILNQFSLTLQQGVAADVAASAADKQTPASLEFAPRAVVEWRLKGFLFCMETITQRHGLAVFHLCWRSRSGLMVRINPRKSGRSSRSR